MKNFVSVCKNVISSNNKRNWVEPDPAIRISHSSGGSAKKRGNRIAIKDSNGNIVANILSSVDGTPVLKCGAKVAIITEYEVEVLE